MSEIDFGAVDDHGCLPHITELVCQLRDIWARAGVDHTDEERQYFLNQIIEQVVVEVGVESDTCPRKKSA